MMKTIGASSTVAPTLPLLVKSSPPFPLRPIELLPRPESQRRPSQRIFLPVADSPRPISSIRLPIPFPLHGSLFVWRQLGAQPTGEPWWSWSWPTETASKGKNSSPPLLSQQSIFGRQPHIFMGYFCSQLMTKIATLIFQIFLIFFKNSMSTQIPSVLGRFGRVCSFEN